MRKASLFRGNIKSLKQIQDLMIMMITVMIITVMVTGVPEVFKTCFD